MVICLERGADLHMAQLMPLPLTVSCFSKIQIGFTFLVPADLGSPRKRAVKHVRMCNRVESWTASRFYLGRSAWLDTHPDKRSRRSVVLFPLFRFASIIVLGATVTYDACQQTHTSVHSLLNRHASFTRICNCRIFRLLPHLSHISAKGTSHIFPHKLTFSTTILTFFVLLYLFLLGFVTSTIWLPTDWHHPCVRTPVERDGVAGFTQFCTTFLE